MTNWTTILSGIVGSHAYGLAGPASNIDTLAVAAAAVTTTGECSTAVLDTETASARTR